MYSTRNYRSVFSADSPGVHLRRPRPSDGRHFSRPYNYEDPKKRLLFRGASMFSLFTGRRKKRKRAKHSRFLRTSKVQISMESFVRFLKIVKQFQNPLLVVDPKIAIPYHGVSLLSKNQNVGLLGTPTSSMYSSLSASARTIATTTPI